MALVLPLHPFDLGPLLGRRERPCRGCAISPNRIQLALPLKLKLLRYRGTQLNRLGEERARPNAVQDRMGQQALWDIPQRLKIRVTAPGPIPWLAVNVNQRLHNHRERFRAHLSVLPIRRGR